MTARPASCSIMDAYELANKLIDLWRPLVISESGVGPKSSTMIPVYVQTGDQLTLVNTVETVDNKIIIKTK